MRQKNGAGLYLFIGFMMKRVLVFGTFDIIHKGHEYFLKQAKRYGNFLIAVVTRNINVKRQKGYTPVNNEKVRLKNIKKLKLVDKALLGEKSISYKLIEKLKPDVICIGYDQRPRMTEAKEILRKLSMKKVILKKIKAYKPTVYKSSLFQTRFKRI